MFYSLFHVHEKIYAISKPQLKAPIKTIGAEDFTEL